MLTIENNIQSSYLNCQIYLVTKAEGLKLVRGISSERGFILVGISVEIMLVLYCALDENKPDSYNRRVLIGCDESDVTDINRSLEFHCCQYFLKNPSRIER